MPYVDITSNSVTIRINYNYSYNASTDASTISITKLQISSTGYTGTYYPSGEIKIGSTVVIDMDSYYGTHSVYIGNSNGTLYNVSGSVGSTTIKHNGSMAPTFTFTCNDVDGVSGSSGKTIWTVNGSKTVNAYKVAYNANGGSGAPATQAKLSGSTLTLSSTKPTKANTTGSTYTMTFNGNGGSPSKTSASAASTLSYSFKNWNTASGGTGTAYSAGASYTANAAATLYAQYNTTTSYGSITTATATKSNTTATRTISFDATTNGGVSNPSSINSTATVTYSPKDNSWYNASSGGSAVATMGASYKINSNQTVYAQWNSTTGTYSKVTLPTATKNNTYKYWNVSFDVNGGNGSYDTLTSTQTTTYSLKGWYTAASGGTKRDNDYIPSASEKLYAQFTASTGAYSPVTLPSPTRLGYAFLGWAENPDADYGEFGSYVPSKDVTLYAIWGALGSVKIKDKDGIHSYVPFIYTNKQWVRAVPFVRTDKAWIRAGGE
jgi:hypothetical protein